jgi:hypothetical protein
MAMRNKVSAEQKIQKSISGGEWIDDGVPFRAKERADKELLECDLGVEAGLAGRRNDYTKSVAWQHGWAEVQDNLHAIRRSNGI